ncbi:tape measure protein [uncultured Intestinimonas sp.]|uniref:tape measure protein n=1 Tax=uncultured Intestinimonas sp. TaxID=1689265 RepID=UPI0025F3B0B2|nr:tape measure protein [uncultured Intestinimonas sp.]
MAGNVASQWADVIVGSSFGGEVGGLFSGALSGAASGASLGTLLGGPVGTAIGAAIGGALGLAGGAAQSYQSRDQAFMGYYGGLYETASQATESSLTAGTETAAQRELDAIAFDKLLYGQGDEFLTGLRETAARTPFEYADLTAMGRNLATGFGSDPERMLELMTAIGDAGATVGASTSDMQWMATALSRMQSTDLAQLGEINMFQDRGVDVIGMLAEAYGKNEGDIRSMISSGDIGGREAVSIIQAALSDSNGPYAGSMALMAETFDGLTSTLSDAMTEIDNATGEGYNEKAKEGLQADIDAYGGELGEALSTANEIIGEGKAIAENLDRQYSREALSALTLGTDTTVYGEEQAAALQEMHGQYTDLVEQYQTASEEDKAIIAGEIEALKEEAQAMADNAYDASDMAQSLQDVELDLIAAIRDNTAALGSAAWGRDYRTSQELGKGQMAVSDDGGSAIASSYQDWVQASNTDAVYTPHAAGLDRVPYDGYAALLHEGERVLTAREAREQDRGQKAPIQITITGNSFGAGVSAEEIAQRLADQIELHMAAGVL